MTEVRHRAPRDPGEPEWGDPFQYQILFKELDYSSRPGDISLLCSLWLAAGAVAAFIWAELYWQGVEPMGTGLQRGVGIGSSGYASTLYMRALALAGLSVMFGLISLIRRKTGRYGVTLWSSAPPSRPPDSQ